MPYSSRILVAALLLLGTAQTGVKALALPLPSPVTQTSTTLSVPDPVPAAPVSQPAEEVLLAQQTTPPAAPPTAQGGGFAWWWLLPIAAGVGALGWAVSRRGSTTTESSTPRDLATASAPPPPSIPAADAAPSAVAPSALPSDPSSVAPKSTDPVPTTSESEVTTSEVTTSEVTTSEVTTSEASTSEASDHPATVVVEEVSPALEDPWLETKPVVTEEKPAVAEAPAPETPVTPAATALEEPIPPSSVEAMPTPQPSAVPVIAVAPGAAGLAAGAAAAMASTEDQTDIEARKFDVVGQPTDGDLDLSSIDDGLPPLPDGYGESRMVLMPRDPQWAYVYWDIPHTHKEDLRRQGGERLALRLYDVTNIDRNYQAPHGMQQCDGDELARDWYLQIPVSDRDYQAEIGYLTGDGRWLLLARSNTIRIPPIYPSDWSEDHFKTVAWEEDLRGKTLMTLVDPNQKSRGLHEQMYAISQAGEAERVDGSLYGSMQHVPGSVPHVPGSMQQVAGSIQHVPGSAQQVAGSIQHVAGSMAPYQSAESSYAWGASGAGLLQGMPGPGGAVPTLSGIGMMSGVGMGAGMSGVGMSGVGMSGMNVSDLNVSGLNVSGLNMSGISGLTMSGVGFSASMPPARPRKFWLVADAELIVYGATEPDATVTIGGQPIQLSPEGTFRVHTSFPDGNIDYPIMAVAADGEQNRSIHMTFDRQTPDRRTNTKEEAQDEWFQG